jgi:hypothetical protein
MGASISVNLSKKSYDAASGTSVIHVEVTLTSNAGTHNHYTDENRGAIFTIIIDDREYSGVCPFGSSDSGTFKDTLFSSDISVVHSTDSTTSFFVHASLYTGTSAGTVSDSASMSLAPAGGSSGGSGGGSDSGDDDYTGGGTVSSINGIVISNDSEFERYRCYIDTYHEVTREVKFYCDCEPMSVGYKFVTPSFLAGYDVVTVALLNVYFFVGDGYYANLTMNIRNADGTLLASNGTSRDSNVNAGNLAFALHPSVPLEPNTEYRIFISSSGDDEDAEVSYTFGSLSVEGDNTGMVDEYLEYTPYIDNGTGWDPYL